MAKMTSTDFCQRLKYLAMSRASQYSNKFPYNCLYIHSGYISADCTGLVKSLINEPSIYNKTSPVGYYVKPSQVIPDTTVKGILDLCSGTSSNFGRIEKGEFLAMLGGDGNKHAGVFVGEFRDGGICNTVESTCDWGANKITTSYTDEQGYRWDHKGGTRAPSKWDYHGKLDKYIDYSEKENPEEYPYEWKRVWVLIKPDGSLVKGWQKMQWSKGTDWFYFDKNGIMLTGWQKLKWSKGTDWFYFDDKNGNMLLGWQKLKWSKGTDWFYFDKNGAMVTGTQVIDGKTYKFDSNGALIS